MRLFKIMFSQDQRTKMYECHIKDYTNKEEVRGTSRNPVLAFTNAEAQLTERLHYVTNPDPADYQEDFGDD